MSVTAPLTLQQQFYWRIYDGGKCLHRLDPFAHLVSGPLCGKLVERCFELLSHRHAALRTSVQKTAGTPSQRIEDPSSFRLRMLDLSTTVGELDADENYARTLLESEGSYLIDLSSAPLFRVDLLTLRDQRHLLVVWSHHLWFDGGGFRVLWQEFWQLYCQHRAGSASNLKGPAPQYIEYGRWQEQALRKSQQRRQEYWRKRLEGSSAIRWPYGPATQPASPRPEAVEARRVLSDTLSRSIRRWTPDRPTLDSLKILTAYVAAVTHLTGQQDVVVATTFVGRDRPEDADIIGLFIEPLYLRIRLTQRDTISDLTAQVTGEYFNSLVHKDFGETAMVYPELCGRALFQWFPPGELSASADLDALGLSVAPFPVKHHWPFPEQNDLQIIVYTAGENLCLWVRYLPDVVPAEFAEQLLRVMETVLENAVSVGKPSLRAITYDERVQH